MKNRISLGKIVYTYTLLNYVIEEMFELHQITLMRGKKTLLDKASARVDPNTTVGLVGRNGAGKTSLLKLLMGELNEDHGSVFKAKNLHVAHLAQELPSSDHVAFAFVRSGDQAWIQLQEKIAQAELENDGLKLGELYEQMEAIDGYRIDARTSIILNGLGFAEEIQQQPVSQFSGGWQMRLQLARVLISRADILLLDEPTNHLDLETILWLEKWLHSYPGTIVIISHDREFLDHVTSHTLSIVRQKLTLYRGNYSSYATQFQEALALQEKSNEKTLKKKQHLQKFVDRFKAKASKAKQAQSRVKAIQKLQMSQDLHEESGVSFKFLDSSLAGDPLITMQASLGYGETVILDNLQLNIRNGDRIGIIGINGSGKSTLLKSIAQQLPPITGELLQHPKTQIGYFSQHQVDMLDPSATAIAHLLNQDQRIEESKARGYLGSFGFKSEQAFTPVETFSGGEKARLALALLIWQRPNILVMDEPTNHLDMFVREALMVALQSFEGAVLLVSHDRYFLECCVNELWLVNHGTVTPYKGSLNDYAIAKQASMKTDAKTQTKEEKKSKPPSKDNKKLIAQLERELGKLEQELIAVEQSLANPELYQEKISTELSELTEQQRRLHRRIEKKEKQWLRLSEPQTPK
jgi:ATP-binding cassette, subfamily F, member 3